MRDERNSLLCEMITEKSGKLD